MNTEITLNVNRREYRVSVNPNDTLLDVLRERLGLTGTKKGCDVGDCGACTVLLNGKPVNSCIVLAVDVGSNEITTIEGLSEDGQLHALQEAFVKYGAVQCGFCIPGILMTLKAFLDEEPHPSKEQIMRAISGNLCRCGSYHKIAEAAIEASKALHPGDSELRLVVNKDRTQNQGA